MDDVSDYEACCVRLKFEDNSYIHFCLSFSDTRYSDATDGTTVLETEYHLVDSYGFLPINTLSIDSSSLVLKKKTGSTDNNFSVVKT